MMRYSLEVANDAGLLREYVAEHYGPCLTYGASLKTWDRAMAQVRRLARLAGLTVEEVMTQAQEDYQQMEDERERQEKSNA